MSSIKTASVLVVVSFAGIAIGGFVSEAQDRDPPDASTPQGDEGRETATRPQSGERNVDRDSWWFPSEIATGKDYRFRLEFKLSRTGVGRSTPIEESFEVIFEVRRPEAGEGGCIVRLKPPEIKGRATGPMSSWLTGVAYAFPQGIHVSETGIMIDGAPLLRGPWRKGDRPTFITVFLSVLFPNAIGVIHADVVDANSKGAHLALEFWAGESGPEMRGDGRLRFESDRLGLTFAELNWTWKDRAGGVKNTLSISRTGIGEPLESTPKDASREMRNQSRQARPPGEEGGQP